MRFNTIVDNLVVAYFLGHPVSLVVSYIVEVKWILKTSHACRAHVQLLWVSLSAFAYLVYIL